MQWVAAAKDETARRPARAEMSRMLGSGGSVGKGREVRGERGKRRRKTVGAVLCGRKRGKVSFVIPLGGREKDKKERARCGESLDVPEAVLKGGEERSLVSGG
jgi:hypothetical protein